MVGPCAIDCEEVSQQAEEHSLDGDHGSSVKAENGEGLGLRNNREGQYRRRCEERGTRRQEERTREGSNTHFHKRSLVINKSRKDLYDGWVRERVIGERFMVHTGSSWEQ